MHAKGVTKMTMRSGFKAMLAAVVAAAVAVSSASSAPRHATAPSGKAAAAYTVRIGDMTIPRSWLLFAERTTPADPVGMVVGSYTVRVGDMTVPKSWLGLR